MNGRELIDAILTAAVFVLVFSAWTIGVVLWLIQCLRLRKKIELRLGFGASGFERSRVLQLWRDDYENRRRQARGRRESLSERLERFRQDAGWRTPAPLVLLGVAVLAVFAGAVAPAMGYGIGFGFGASAIVIAAFWILTKKRIAARLALFERQFLDSLGMAARALRAGHPLVGAFQLVSREVKEPVGRLFGEICQEQSLGLNLEDSIRRVADASANGDLKLFATAVSIQMRSGGNLAELMDSLANVMRARMRLNRRIRVLAAQTNMNKSVLIALPIMLFVLLNVIAPAYTQLFYTTWAGRYMLIGTTLSVMTGAWAMSRLAVIRY
jgi:tight adherence protein B